MVTIRDHRLCQNGYHYDIDLALSYASSEVGDRTFTLVLSPPFDRLCFYAERKSEGLTEAALGLFGRFVFFGVDPAEMPTALGQFLEQPPLLIRALGTGVQ